MRFIYNALRLQSRKKLRIQTRISHQLRDAKLYDRSIQECHALPAAILYHLGYRIRQDHLKEFYETCGFPYVSYHPMFGRHSPIWDNWRKKYDHYLRRGSSGKDFFKDIYSSLACISANIRSRTRQSVAYSLVSVSPPLWYSLPR